MTSQSPESVGFFMSAVRRIADGLPPAGEITPAMQAAADYYGTLLTFSRIALLVAGIALAAFCLSAALRHVQRDFAPQHGRALGHRRPVAGGWHLDRHDRRDHLLGPVQGLFRFFQKVPLTEFLFGLQWSPQTALRADQVGSTGAFGAVPLFVGTLLITLIAMLVAGPIGMFSAIYLSQYASPTFRAWAKPILEVLAGIPTVVYGFFAALTVAPLIRSAGQSIGLDVSSESALAAGLVMGIMIIPFVSSRPTTPSRPCRRLCATHPMGWAPRARKPSSRS